MPTANTFFSAIDGDAAAAAESDAAADVESAMAVPEAVIETPASTRTYWSMAQHIRGPLYYERMGRSGPVMAFVHPNPMDQSCWIFQMAHFSTWYRCIAIDIPGYGDRPRPSRA